MNVAATRARSVFITIGALTSLRYYLKLMYKGLGSKKFCLMIMDYAEKGRVISIKGCSRLPASKNERKSVSRDKWSQVMNNPPLQLIQLSDAEEKLVDIAEDEATEFEEKLIAELREMRDTAADLLHRFRAGENLDDRLEARLNGQDTSQEAEDRRENVKDDADQQLEKEAKDSRMEVGGKVGQASGSSAAPANLPADDTRTAAQASFDALAKQYDLSPAEVLLLEEDEDINEVILIATKRKSLEEYEKQEQLAALLADETGLSDDDPSSDDDDDDDEGDANDEPSDPTERVEKEAEKERKLAEKEAKAEVKAKRKEEKMAKAIAEVSLTKYDSEKEKKAGPRS